MSFGFEECGHDDDTSLLAGQSRLKSYEFRPIAGVRDTARHATAARRRVARSVGRPTVEMKMAAEVRWLLVLLICCAVSPGRGETPHRKFEYKYSFKPPYLAQKDGSVPFWEYGGSE